MAAEAEVDGGEVVAPAKKKLPIMLIAMIAAGVVLIGGGAAAYFLLFSAPQEAASEAHAAPVHESFIFNLPPMTVNLNTDDGGARRRGIAASSIIRFAASAVETRNICM